MLYQPLALVGGGIILIFLAFDLFRTIAQASEGPAARLVQMGMQRVLRALYHITGARHVLVWSTSLLILCLVSMWTVLLYTGWFLIFLGNDYAVLRAKDQSPASIGERLYFTGFTISTLGVGDYVPHGTLWQFITSICALTGFFLLTFMISFILNVTEKQALRRRLALNIHHLGITPYEIVTRLYMPSANKVSGNVLDSILPDLIEFEQQHLEQPILNRFHGPMAKSSIQLTLAVLDESLTLLDAAVDVTLPTQFSHARRAITGYLESVDRPQQSEPDDAPPIPDLAVLHAAGLPLYPTASVQSAYAEVSERRCKLIELVHESGWTWEDVVAPDRSD